MLAASATTTLKLAAYGAGDPVDRPRPAVAGPGCRVAEDVNPARNRATQQHARGCADALPYPGGPVTGPNEGHQERLGIDGVVLRQRLASVAAYIACTEDQVAATLERMALAWPEDA